MTMLNMHQQPTELSPSSFLLISLPQYQAGVRRIASIMMLINAFISQLLTKSHQSIVTRLDTKAWPRKKCVLSQQPFNSGMTP